MPPLQRVFMCWGGTVAQDTEAGMMAGGERFACIWCEAGAHSPEVRDGDEAGMADPLEALQCKLTLITQVHVVAPDQERGGERGGRLGQRGGTLGQRGGTLGDGYV